MESEMLWITLMLLISSKNSEIIVKIVEAATLQEFRIHLLLEFFVKKLDIDD